MKKITIDQLFQDINSPKYHVSYNFTRKIASIPYAGSRSSILESFFVQYRFFLVLIIFLCLALSIYILTQNNIKKENERIADNTDEIVNDIDHQVDKMLGTVDYWSRINLDNSNYYEEMIPEY